MDEAGRRQNQKIVERESSDASVQPRKKAREYLRGPPRGERPRICAIPPSSGCRWHPKLDSRQASESHVKAVPTGQRSRVQSQEWCRRATTTTATKPPPREPRRRLKTVVRPELRDQPTSIAKPAQGHAEEHDGHATVRNGGSGLIVREREFFIRVLVPVGIVDGETPRSGSSIVK